MKTLIVRKVDETGRVVIPMEMRKELAIKTNQYLKIEKEDNRLILEKFSYDEAKDIIINIVEEVINATLKDEKMLLCIEGDTYYSNYDEDDNIIRKLEEVSLKGDIDIINISKNNSFCAIRINNSYGYSIGNLFIKNFDYDNNEKLLKMISILLKKWNSI